MSVRIYPDAGQDRRLREWLFACSLVHNACISERQIHYRSIGQSPTAFDQIRELPAIRAQDPRLADVLSSTMQQSVLRVDKAFQAFFRGQKNYPRFVRSRHYRSLRFPKHGSDFRYADGRVKLGKIGRMKARGVRADWLTKWNPKSSVVELMRSGKWMMHLQCELPTPHPATHTGPTIGLDMGLSSLATTSDGANIPNPRH